MNEQITLSKSKNRIFIPQIIAIVMSIIIIASIFMPVISAYGDYGSALTVLTGAAYAADEYVGDMAHVSPFSFAVFTGKIESSVSTSTALFVTLMIIDILVGVFGFFCLLNSILKLPVAIIIFDIFSVIPYVIYFSILGKAVNLKMPGTLGGYHYGIGVYAFFAAAVILLAMAIWMKIEKGKIKIAKKVLKVTGENA